MSSVLFFLVSSSLWHYVELSLYWCLSYSLQDWKGAPFNTYVGIVSIGSGCWLSWMFSLFFFCFTTFSFTPLFIFFGNFLINFLFIQHYDRRGQYDISLSKIDEAIEHTPTVIDLYSVKVSVYYKLSFFKLLILYILWLITSMVLHYW